MGTEADARVSTPRREPEAHQLEFKICLDKVLIRPRCPRLSLFPQETAFTYVYFVLQVPICIKKKNSKTILRQKEADKKRQSKERKGNMHCLGLDKSIFGNGAPRTQSRGLKLMVLIACRGKIHEQR